MTIDEAFELCKGVLNKAQNSSISPDVFNNFAPIAQMSVINQLLGNEQEYQPGHPVPRYGFGLSQKVMEDLRTILKPPTLLTFTAGIAGYPADCLYLYDIGLSSDASIVKPVELDEWRILNKSVIKPPTLQYPVYYSVGGFIYIAPSSITNTLVSYVLQPLTPKWAYVITNGVPVFNGPNSQDFQLGPLTHFRICQKILQLAGVNIGLPQVVQLASQLEAQGA